MKSTHHTPLQHLIKPTLTLLLALTVWSMWAILPAYAQGPVVDTALDENDGECIVDCSLRDAIQTVGSGDTITFAADTTIYLNSALQITKSLNIDGSGHTITISGDTGNDGSRNVQVFNIGAGSVVTLNYLNVVSGTASNGAGIYNNGSLTVNYSTIRDNVTTGNDGGGIYNGDTLVVNYSIIRNNQGRDGGGIYDKGVNGNTTTINHSAIYNNTATRYGGGAHNNGGNAKLTLTNSTLSGNHANTLGGGFADGQNAVTSIQFSTIVSNTSGGGGGGLDLYRSTTNIGASIIAYNTSGGSPNNVAKYQATLNSLGYNLEDRNDAGFSATGDQTNTDPLLLSLADYGGATQTHLPQTSSPALDAIPNGTLDCGTTITDDQRQHPRPYNYTGSGCDIGAVEYTEAADDSYTTAEDTTLNVSAPGVLDNDFNGESLTAALTSSPAGGTLNFNSDGSFSYTPSADFYGDVSFTYEVNNGSLTRSATVTLTVTSVNDLPVVGAAETYTTTEDLPLTVTAPGLLANDTDTEGDTLSAYLVSQSANGTVTLNLDGSFIFTPTKDFYGDTSFSYVPHDGDSRSDGSVLDQHQKISDIEGDFSGTLNNDDSLGRAVAHLGDLDGDGVSDIAVGAPYDNDGNNDRGAVWILFLNSDGTVKSHQKISDTEGNFGGTLVNGDYFGFSLANLGDLKGDGTTALAVGAPGSDDGSGVAGFNADERGAVWILFLNSNGTVNSYQKISDTQGNFSGTLNSGDWFGYAVASIGDVNKDGVTDLAVGTSLDDDGGDRRGATWILFLNTNGTVNSYQKISDTAGGFDGQLDNEDRFGSSVAGLGDLNGDGLADLVVGANGDDDGQSHAGAVWVLFLYSDGTVKSYQKISNTAGSFGGSLGTADNFGSAIANLGDLDGDGVIEIAVGKRDVGNSSDKGGFWVLFLNNNGTVKNEQAIAQNQGGFNSTLDGGDLFGAALTPVNDLNGDGVNDLAVGAYGDDDGGSDHGAVWVLLMKPATNAVNVTLTVSPGIVTAVDDDYSTPADTALTVSSGGVLDNDIDLDSDPLTATLVLAPANGSLDLGVDGAFTYTPTVGFAGKDQFLYQVTDSQWTDTALVTITVDSATVPDIPLYGPGWNLFGYPLQASTPVTEALSSIDGYYTTVYGYDATDTTDHWKLYDASAPTWVNDLTSLEFGHGYWISATQNITVSLSTAGSLAAANAPPLPPATYYGKVLATTEFTPTTEMTVETYVDGTLCGSGQTLDPGNGQVWYAIHVVSDAETAGCGQSGETVSFTVAGEAMEATPTWNNNGVWRLDLSPDASTNNSNIYLPIVIKNN